MAKSLLRNNCQSPITLPPPYTGIVAPGDAIVLDDPPSVVIETLGVVPDLIGFVNVTQVPDSQPNNGHDKAEAAKAIAEALSKLTLPLDINGQRVINAADPIAAQDLATKQYVDIHAGGGSGTVQQVNTGAGLTGGPITVTGTLAVDFGDTSGQVTEGNDPRLNPAPTTAGAVVYDTGSAYSETAAGTPGQVLKVGVGGLPEWGTDSTTPAGPAGGSLAGNYPNPTIAASAITDTEVSATAAIATSKLSGPLTDIASNGLASFVDAATLVAQTYYVAVDGNDTTGNGSISAPYATIQKAHDVAALAYTGGEMVMLDVGPGTFTGNVTITRHNTLIQGQGHRAEMFATKVVGAITVNPFTAASKYTHLVGIAGMFVQSSGTAPAVKATGSGLYSLIFNDCYLYTINAAATANAFACDATHAQRPRIVANDCIMATEAAGPAIVQLDRGDARFGNTQILHNSGVTLGSAGNGVVVANDATLWIDRCLVDTRTKGSGIYATGASAGVKLLASNSGITTNYSGVEDTSHGVTVSNTAGYAASLNYMTFTVVDTSAAVYAVNGIAPALVVYDYLNFQPTTNSKIAGTVTLTPLTEVLGTVVLPSLTASLPLQLDANKTVTAAAITLSGTQVTGTLPVGKGGTGISTTPPAGAVAYGNGSTQAYTAVGTSGQPLISAGAGTPAFGALNLAGAGVTGTLPAGNQAAQTMGGDVTGTTAASTVAKIQGRAVDATAPTAGQVYAWSGSAWAPTTVTAGGGGGGGGGGLTYYLNYNIAGDAPLPTVGDKELSLVYDLGGQVNTGAVTAPQSPAVATLAEFVTDLGQPGATTIPPGNWDIAAYMVGSGPNNTFFRARVYKWDGTTLTELSTSPSDWVEILTYPTPTLFTASVYIAQAVLTASERIVIRLEIQRTTAAARTVTGYFNGNTPSHTHTSIGAPGGTGLVKVVSGIVQAPASLLGNADVDANAAIAVSKLAGGTVSTVLHGGPTPSFGAVALGSEVAGQLPVANGGTGLSAGTSGGVPYFNSTSTMASSAALTASALVIGGGAGNAPSTLGSLGTTSTVLHGNASGAPTFGAVALGADVAGTLPIANGGTNGTATPTSGAVAYGTGSAYAFTAQGSAGQLLVSNGIAAPSWVSTVPVANGGTGGTSTPTANGVAYGDGSKYVFTPAGTPGQALIVGVGGSPQWGAATAGGNAGGILGYTASTYPNPNGLIGVPVTGGGTSTIPMLPQSGYTTLTLRPDGTTGSTVGTTLAINAGAGGGTGAGGALNLSAGSAASASGGDVTISGGNSPSASGGDSWIYGGQSSVTAQSYVRVFGSTSSATGAIYAASANVASLTSGEVRIFSGTGADTGQVRVFSGAGTATSGVVFLNSGNAGTGASGAVTVKVGNTTGSVSPGALTIEGGSASTSGVTAGSVNIKAGQNTSDSVYGAINYTAALHTFTGSVKIGGNTYPTTTATAGSLIYASSSSNYANLALGNNGDVLTVVGGVPTWSPAAAGVTSVGFSTGTTGLIVTSSTTNPITSTGTFTLSGTLAVGNGGTGATTLTANGVLLGNATSAISATAVGTNGQLLLGNTGAAPAFATMSGDATITAAGAVTVAKIQGRSVSSTAPTSGQLLTWNSGTSAWEPTSRAAVPYDVAGMVSDIAPANTRVFYFKATRAFTLSSTPADHVFSANIGATNSSIFTVTKNGLTVLTATFGAGGASPQNANISSVSNTAVSVGDVIVVTSPAVADTTLADVYWTLSGSVA